MDDFKLYSRNEKELGSSVQVIHSFSKDIGMEFSKEKFSMLVIEKKVVVRSVGIEFPDYGQVTKSLREDESYKYLGILGADRFLGEEMKLKISNEYFKR